MASSNFETEKQAFLDYVNDNIELLRNAESSFSTLIQSLLATSTELSVATVSSRLKGPKESIKKFSRKYQSELEKEKQAYEIKDYITDLIGVRIICLYEKNIQEVGDILRDNLCLIDSTDKSELIEQAENTFGYKGLHLDMKLDDTREVMPEYSRYKDIVFEVQIRTIIQDAWSVLDHKIKYKKSIPHGLKRRINSLAALFETADREFYSIQEETEKLEKRIKDKSKNANTEREVLNVFHFARIAETYFPETRLVSYKVDALVDEIVKMKQITNDSFETMVRESIETLKMYQELLDGKHTLTMYTIIRHILYFCDKSSFAHILYDNQRQSFDSWLEKQNLTC
jgi:ppGpp synthetase/RelA/SpoT-type nucleotidyltranferase